MKRPTQSDLNSAAATNTLTNLFGGVFFLTAAAMAFGLIVGGDSRWDQKLTAYVVIGGFIAWLTYLVRSGDRRRKSAVEAANKAYGSNFRLDKAFGFSSGTDLVMFDTEAKKIMFNKFHGKCVWVFDFAQVSKWSILWKEETKVQGNAVVTKTNNYQIKFFLDDLQTPSVTMGVGKHSAEDWSHKIGLILSGQKLPD
ncbi:hypothetical protein H8L32_21530 [Undibacterium sp. CY18W]|uniref:Uncharacterized protein n=1 Tax=Undibacterium hunanense TaxID=2762292 RepID=A0ABR6ZWR5_9BURK|nr:hypothetical protein [Undibacterium hunanense]MBC3920063.1 hypothetical protein [Undibacterium hunanense]